MLRYAGQTLVTFVVIAALMFGVDALLNFGRVGSISHGFPIPFSQFTSAPPPAFGTTFSAGGLALDLALYLIVAMGIVAFRARR